MTNTPCALFSAAVAAVLFFSVQNTRASEASYAGTTFIPKSVVPVWSEANKTLTIYLLPVEVTPEQITEIATKGSMFSIISSLKDPAMELEIVFNPDAKTRTLNQVAAYVLRGSAFNGKRGSSISVNRSDAQFITAELTALELDPVQGGKVKVVCAGSDEMKDGAFTWKLALAGNVVVKP